MTSVTVSTIVVIKGEAITAGSSLIFFASMGRIVPIIFANTTAEHAVTDTINAIRRFSCTPNWHLKSITIVLIKQTIPRPIAHKSETRNSFQITLKKSLFPISSSDIARIIATDDWLPALPPVFISMGKNAVKIA